MRGIDHFRAAYALLTEVRGGPHERAVLTLQAIEHMHAGITEYSRIAQLSTAAAQDGGAKP